MDYFLIILASLLIITGVIGCIVPVLPGPPISYIGIIIFHFTRWGDLSSNLLIWLGIITIVVTVMDYVLPVWTTRKFGGSKRGVWGSTIGLVIGLFVFPPWGIIICPFVGAFIGEMTANSDHNKAFRSAIGSFVGFLLGTGAKFAACGIMIFYFVKELFG